MKEFLELIEAPKIFSFAKYSREEVDDVIIRVREYLVPWNSFAI